MAGVGSFYQSPPSTYNCERGVNGARAAKFTKYSQNISYYDIFMWYNIYSKREEGEPMSGTILLILALMVMMMAAGHH